MRITKIGIPPGGDTNQVLVKSSGTDYDVEWGTGSGTATPPGGTNTQVQFNDGGVFGGDAGFTYNKTTNRLTLGSLVLNDVIDPGVDTDKFLVLTSLGVVSYRNGASVLVDIGGVPTSRTLTINGTSYDLSNNRTWSVGTVTSIGITAGTGISVSGSPITGSGSITVTNSAPDQTVALTQGGTTTITGTYPNFIISSADQYVGTVTSIATSAPITGGTITGSGTIGITQASGSSDGYLSSTDWTTFNNKQNALTNPVTGTGTSGQVAYFNGTTSITSESNLFWDAANDRLGIGTASPAYKLDVNGIAGVLGLWSLSGNGILTWNPSNSEYWRLNTTSANSLTFDIGGSEKMRITSGGNVLIGTTTDSGYKLDVNGTGRFQDKLTLATGTNQQKINWLGYNSAYTSITSDVGFDSTYNGTYIINNTNSTTSAQGNTSLPSWQLTLGGSDSFRIDRSPAGSYSFSTLLNLNSSGNLGLGVTPSAWETGRKALQIGAAAAIDCNNNTQAILSANRYFDGTNDKRINLGEATAYQQLNGQHIWYTAGSSSAGSNITFTQAMTLDSSGRLGIGTPSPQSPLDVITPANGYASFGRNISVGQWTGIHFGYREDNTNYRKAAIVFERTGAAAQGNIHFLNNNAADITSASLSDSKMVLTANGDLIIGSGADTGESLQVTGDAKITHSVSGQTTLKIRNSNALGYSGIEYFDSAGNVDLYIGLEQGGGGARYNSLEGGHKLYNNSVEHLNLKTTGQLKLNNYTTTTSFSGTPVGYLAFENDGDIITRSPAQVLTDIGAEPTLTKGNLTEATSSVLTITGGTGSIIGSGTSIEVKQASGSQSGYLSSTDWTTFNNKGSGSIGGSGTDGYIAKFSGGSTTLGNSNIISVGSDATWFNTFSGSGSGGNIMIGHSASTITTGADNISLGRLSLDALTTGYNNVAIGTVTMSNLTTGYENIAVGELALDQGTSAYANTAIGYLALGRLTTGGNNTALGFGAGRYISGNTDNQTSVESIYIGKETKASANGNSYEIVIGNYVTGNGTNTATIGDSNTTTYTNKINLTGGQLTFPATQNASANVNTLDDYEEGVWTPTLLAETTNFTSVTYDSRTTGTYTKIGNTVFINGVMWTDAVNKGSGGGAAAGNIAIGGLPFTTSATNGKKLLVNVADASAWLADEPLSGASLDTATRFILYKRATSNGATTPVVVADVNTTADDNIAYFQGFYSI